MKTMLYEGKSYMVTQEDVETVAVRSEGVNRVSILTMKDSGEITVISRCVPWIHTILKSEETA